MEEPSPGPCLYGRAVFFWAIHEDDTCATLPVAHLASGKRLPGRPAIPR